MGESDARTIDFKKVDASFQRLADDGAVLSDFGAALNKLRDGLGELNDFEAQYVASALINQRVGVQSNAEAKGARVVSGFVIKSAVT